jgi:alkylhydroperoxidase family enzyme
MAYISYQDGDDAPPELREFYRELSPAGEPIDNILRIHSLNPPSMRHHFDLYRHLMRGRSDLSRAEREMIAMVVSKVNACHY